MIPDHALVTDAEGDIWSCIDGRWYCATQRDNYGVTPEDLLDICGPLDVHVWRATIKKDQE